MFVLIVLRYRVVHFTEIASMARRSSSTSSLYRPQDFSKTAPFVPREVFRLVLRLEAEKSLDVNVSALERRFRVPPGYADDESLNARGEMKQPKDFVPGPGAYEVPEQWPVRDVTATPTAAFLSRTMRGPFSPTHPVTLACLSSPTRQVAVVNKRVYEKVLRPYTSGLGVQSASRPTKSPHSRLRLPSPSDRRDLLIQIPDHQQNQVGDHSSSTDTSASSTLNLQNTSAFSKLAREPENEKESVPAVGSYDIKRLWDSNTRRTTLGAPSPALFGASKEKRVVTWRPALTPASYTVSTSWNSSRHYAKQKKKVVRIATKRRLQSAKLHARTPPSPQLRPSTADAVMQSEATSTDPVALEAHEDDDDDPFSWLRQRPNGENRVNFLAAKHGLVHHIKSPTRRSTEHRHQSTSTCEEQGAKLVRQHSNLMEDGETHGQQIYTSKPKDVRIKVSCRMPGGMLISASVYSLKKLGHFKSAILLRQKRFQSVDEFDLYHTSGRKLTGLDETLVSCGVYDRSSLQVVPVVTVALSHQVGNQTTSDVH